MKDLTQWSASTEHEEALVFSMDEQLLKQFEEGGAAVPTQRSPTDRAPTSATSHRSHGPTHWRGYARQQYGFFPPDVCAGITPRPRSPIGSFARRIDAKRCL